MPHALRRILWLLPLCLVACEDRVAQCNTLISRLNPHTEAMIAGVEGLSHIESEPERLAALRSTIERADRDLAAVELREAPLAEFSRRYRGQLEDAHTAAEAMGAAAKSGDANGLHAAATQADAFLDAQALIVEELNAYCSGVGD